MSRRPSNREDGSDSLGDWVCCLQRLLMDNYCRGLVVLRFLGSEMDALVIGNFLVEK